MQFLKTEFKSLTMCLAQVNFRITLPRKRETEENRDLTKGMPLAALSSKYLEGLKKSPYCSDHFLRLAYTCLGPTKSPQNRRPPLHSRRKPI